MRPVGILPVAVFVRNVATRLIPAAEAAGGRGAFSPEI